MIKLLITLMVLALVDHSAIASVVSFVKNDVHSIQDTNKVAAALNDQLQPDTQIGTGDKSMCELSFDDKSVTRIGEHSVFSFQEQERLIKCGDGKFLVSKDPETAPITVTAGGVTAAIAGSTVLFDVKGGIAHVAVVETTSGVTVTDENGKAVTLQSGEGIAAAPGGLASAGPRPVDVKAMTEASPLFTEAGLAPLANAAAIQGVIGAQNIAKQAGASFASDINDVMSGKMDGATALAKTGGMDVPDIDTAAGGEAAGNNAPAGSGAGAISGSQQFNPLMNPNLVPPVNSKPNPFEATPI
jgi:hypothetical protein